MMPKLNPQQAEQLHARYAATLTNPLSIETFIPGGELDDIIFNTYTHGMLHHDEQLLRIRIAQFNSMDPAEPYDIGVANAIQLLNYILTGVLPTFIPKPPSMVAAMDQLQVENAKLNAKAKKLEQKLLDAKSELESAVAAKSLAILALETKHARELEEVAKAAEPTPEPAPEPKPEPVKPKKKSWLGKNK